MKFPELLSDDPRFVGTNNGLSYVHGRMYQRSNGCRSFHSSYYSYADIPVLPFRQILGHRIIWGQGWRQSRRFFSPNRIVLYWWFLNPFLQNIFEQNFRIPWIYFQNLKIIFRDFKISKLKFIFFKKIFKNFLFRRKLFSNFKKHFQNFLKTFFKF